MASVTNLRPRCCKALHTQHRLPRLDTFFFRPCKIQLVSSSRLQSYQPSVTCRSGSETVASTGAPANQISSALMDSMTQKIQEALEAQTVSVTDMYGDGRHVAIDVVSKQFEGKNAMQRQRMVYKAIWLELQEAVHAVDSMVTKTPEEAGL